MLGLYRNSGLPGSKGGLGPALRLRNLKVLRAWLIELSFVEVGCFQSRKHLACFSETGRTCHDVNAD